MEESSNIEQEIADANVNKLKTGVVRACEGCRTQQSLYLCDNGHGISFCKPCLIATFKTENAVRFKHKCKSPICNFNPL